MINYAFYKIEKDRDKVVAYWVTRLDANSFQIEASHDVEFFADTFIEILDTEILAIINRGDKLAALYRLNSQQHKLILSELARFKNYEEQLLQMGEIRRDYHIDLQLKGINILKKDLENWALLNKYEFDVQPKSDQGNIPKGLHKIPISLDEAAAKIYQMHRRDKYKSKRIELCRDFLNRYTIIDKPNYTSEKLNNRTAQYLTKQNQNSKPPR